MAELARIRCPDDFHVHLREPGDLSLTVPASARTVARVLAMPNTRPPLTEPDQLRAYAKAIVAAASGGPAVTPLLTFRIGTDVPPESIAGLAEAGAVAGKLYPRGATTNSADGAEDLSELYPLLDAMQDAELVLCVHAEEPKAPLLDRERVYLSNVERLVRDFPRLRIVIEHISTVAAVELLVRMPETVGATVTVHHLLYTIDDLAGGLLDPHLFCKPVLKTDVDRGALRELVASGDPRVFYGSDSAPHPRASKEGRHAAAGIFSAPVAIELLAELFTSMGLPLERSGGPASLERFVSELGARFYRLSLNESQLAISDEGVVVPQTVGEFVPLSGGARLRYRCRRL